MVRLYVDVPSCNVCYCAIVLSAAVATMALVQSTSWKDKSFRLVTTCNGSEVCAGDSPTVGFTILPNQTGSIRLSPVKRCLSLCKVESSCVGLNFKDDLQQCELFMAAPNTFLSVQRCRFYEVMRLRFMISWFKGVTQPTL